jgi:hypothetical protein
MPIDGLSACSEIGLSRKRAKFISVKAKLVGVCGPSGENYNAQSTKICPLQAKIQLQNKLRIKNLRFLIFFKSLRLVI